MLDPHLSALAARKIPVRRISRVLRVSEPAVVRRIDALGLYRRPPHLRLSPEVKREIARLQADGHAVEQIAAIAGVTLGAVVGFLERRTRDGSAT